MALYSLTFGNLIEVGMIATSLWKVYVLSSTENEYSRSAKLVIYWVLIAIAIARLYSCHKAEARSREVERELLKAKKGLKRAEENVRLLGYELVVARERQADMVSTHRGREERLLNTQRTTVQGELSQRVKSQALQADVHDLQTRLSNIQSQQAKHDLLMDWQPTGSQEEPSQSRNIPSRDLQVQVESLQAQLKTQKSISQSLLSWQKHQTQNLQSQVGSLRTQLSSIQNQRTTTQRLGSQNLQNDMNLLQTKVNTLQNQVDLVAPLVRIGTAVRLRNLEQARETVMSVRAEDVDRALIRRGNMAAHRGDGIADAALFKAGLIPAEHLTVATQVFEKLYMHPPMQYWDYPD